MKKVFSPFYKSFECVANKCPINCCALRVPFFEWEVEEFDKRPEWQDIDGNKHSIKDFIHRESGKWMCNTRDHNFCTFCTDDRLCGLRLKNGANAEPAVCKNFPRMVTEFPDRIEYTLDPCCPIANYSLKDWKIGEFIVEGESSGAEADDSARQIVVASFADPETSLRDCFQLIADTYGVSATVRIPDLSTCKETFLRKMCAYHFWSYVLAYEGYPGFDNIGGTLLEFFAEYVPTVGECHDDWNELSRHFSTALISFVRRTGFDLEMED